MSATQTERERGVPRRARRQERLLFAVAVLMTVTMFGWQGYHLYWADQAASHTRTTSLVEAISAAGEVQAGLVHDLEHDVLVLGQRLSRQDVADWADRYAAASADSQAATAAALDDAGENLTDAADQVDTARSELDRQVGVVLEQLETGESERVSAALLDPAYLAAQAEFDRALDGQIAGLAADLDDTTSAERLNELHSVTIALALFTAAIGAWAIFNRRLRRSRARLAEEHEQRLETEAELFQLQKMEALGMMADGVAHDVKNLTLIISESAKDVRATLPSEHPASLAVGRIEEATRQADDVARALLAFGRKDEPRQGAVDLASLTVGMTQLLRYMVPSNIELVMETPAAAWVHGDAVQLQQAIFNLAANARDAMSEGGTLTITVRSASPEDHGDWLLEVRDTGEGMTPDVERRVFDPFFTTRAAEQGSGLGLAIVARAVKSHRGWIDISTRPGEGSTFTIGLPAIPAPTPVAADPDPSGSTILVADPVSFVRDLITGALAAEGHHVTPASTVGEIGAIFAGQRSGVDLVVIDSGFGRSGLDLVPPDIPIIVTGAAASLTDLDGRAGARVLGEPLSLAEVTRSAVDLLQPSDLLAQR